MFLPLPFGMGKWMLKICTSESEIIAEERRIVNRSCAISCSPQNWPTDSGMRVSDKVKNITGEYFVDCKIVDTSKLSEDRNIAKELWEVSEKDVGLSLLKNALSGLGEYLRKVF
ncbi:hypothetical protein Anas_10343 [Armadillidium nasatum]|uniref:Uncharacterized protein n=1 Tax=Armadillidium nasatum TaxID=96803 RepID=A0A5N5SQ60_9CRUS|nr:hypothetical protein Anas_10343 [Armadillidium nasatum]